jgi:hypothetical protein
MASAAHKAPASPELKAKLDDIFKVHLLQSLKKAAERSVCPYDKPLPLKGCYRENPRHFAECRHQYQHCEGDIQNFKTDTDTFLSDSYNIYVANANAHGGQFSQQWHSTISARTGDEKTQLAQSNYDVHDSFYFLLLSNIILNINEYIDNYIDQPYGYIDQPYGYIDQPYGYIDQPYGYIDQPYGEMFLTTIMHTIENDDTTGLFPLNKDNKSDKKIMRILEDNGVTDMRLGNTTIEFCIKNIIENRKKSPQVASSQSSGPMRSSKSSQQRYKPFGGKSKRSNTNKKHSNTNKRSKSKKRSNTNKRSKSKKTRTNKRRTNKRRTNKSKRT